MPAVLEQLQEAGSQQLVRIVSLDPAHPPFEAIDQAGLVDFRDLPDRMCEITG